MFTELFFILFGIYVYNMLQRIDSSITEIKNHISSINKQYESSLKTQLTILENHITLLDMCDKISNIFQLQQKL